MPSSNKFDEVARNRLIKKKKDAKKLFITVFFGKFFYLKYTANYHTLTKFSSFWKKFFLFLAMI